MDNSFFFRHYQLAQDGFVVGLPCINDDHDILYPFVDAEKGNVYYECLICDYRITPGLLSYNNIRDEVLRVSAEQWQLFDDQSEALDILEKLEFPDEDE